MMERVEFTNSLGQRLIGVLHFGSSPKSLGPAVVLCHGMMSSKEGRKQVAFAGALEEQGFSVLRFDFSFCGESGGVFEEITFAQEIDDLASAVRWLKQEGAGPLGLLGSSMGGAVAILYAGREPQVRALVTIAAVAHPDRLVSRMDRLEQEVSQWKREGYQFGAEGTVGSRFLEEVKGLDIPAALSRLHVPILLLHGAEDEIVPAIEARVLFAQAAGPKELKIFPGGDHRLTAAPDLGEAIRMTIAWFGKYLRS